MENENNQLPLEDDNSEAVLEQAAPAEETPKSEPVQMQKGILLTPGKLVGLICGIVVLVAVLVGAIVYGMGGFAKDDAETVPETSVPVETASATDPAETAPATIPADTGANDVTHKGSYTVSDEEIVKLADTVVATIGDDVLTNRDLQVYYWMQVQNFFSNYYYYLSYFGLDYTQPLDVQVCNVMENGYTWQQYFLEQALVNWHSYQALANVSLENGLEITGEERTYLDTLADTLTTSAQAQGYADAQGLVEFNMGKGGDLESYIAYEELFLQGNLYYVQQEEAIVLTDEEIEAYFDANAEYYAESGITKDGVYVDVRHILIVPEGKNPGDEYTDEEWESCRASAQAILDQWLAGDRSEESFAQLANEHSVDSDGTDGGLYEDVYVGQMVENFENWCFDERRQYGDYGLVQTEYGYHIMYFVGSEPMWRSYAESGLMQERTAAIVSDARDMYPMEVDYSAIALGLVDISKWFEQ